MLQALNSGDPTWMDALLDTWASARTQTELEARASSLPVILNQIHLITFELAREKLIRERCIGFDGGFVTDLSAWF